MHHALVWVTRSFWYKCICHARAQYVVHMRACEIKHIVAIASMLHVFRYAKGVKHIVAMASMLHVFWYTRMCYARTQHIIYLTDTCTCTIWHFSWNRVLHFAMKETHKLAPESVLLHFVAKACYPRWHWRPSVTVLLCSERFILKNLSSYFFFPWRPSWIFEWRHTASIFEKKLSLESCDQNVTKEWVTCQRSQERCLHKMSLGKVWYKQWCMYVQEQKIWRGKSNARVT
jgi:hypothetical protein